MFAILKKNKYYLIYVCTGFNFAKHSLPKTLTSIKFSTSLVRQINISDSFCILFGRQMPE